MRREMADETAGREGLMAAYWAEYLALMEEERVLEKLSLARWGRPAESGQGAGVGVETQAMRQLRQELAALRVGFG